MFIFPADPVLVQLRADIEALAVHVTDVTATHLGKEPWSKTIGGTAFTTIANDRPKAEGAPLIQLRPLKKMALFSLTSARALCAAVKGPALLTWRDFSYEPGVSLWIRLAFEGNR